MTLPEKRLYLLNALDQTVKVVFAVVQGQRRAHGCRNLEVVHDWLRAMVPCANCYAIPSNSVPMSWGCTPSMTKDKMLALFAAFPMMVTPSISFKRSVP